jgi:filamin/ABP280 repeat protein
LKATTSGCANGTTKRAVVFALTVLAGCGGDSLVLPSNGEPARISIVDGNNQSGTVGQPLGDSLVVKVTDTESRPVSGVEIVFVPPDGAAIAPNDTVRTGTDGQAAVAYTLSTIAGQQMVQARAARIVPATSASATFMASAEPEGAVALVAAGGDRQRGEVATVLPESLAVRAVDRFGNGVPRIEVTWKVKGGGDVSPGSVTTGTDGRAAAARTLGERPGSFATEASAEGLAGSPVAFSATAIAAPQPELVLVTPPSSEAAAGVALAQQPELQLQDPTGAPLPRKDVKVTVQIADGGGSLGGSTTAKSDENGRVTFTDLALRGEAGTRTLIFAAEGFTPVTSAAITVRPGPPAADRSSLSVPNGTAGVATPIALHLEDEFGNAITGAAALISLEIAGANPAAGVPVTDLGDGSYSASYLPIHSGIDVVSAGLGGQPLPGSPVQSVVVPGPADPAHTTADVTRTAGLFTRISAAVTVRDAQDNPVGRGGDRVQVQVNDIQPIDAVDNGDGSYSFSLIIFATQFNVVITLNGTQIPGSPFTPRVE